MRHEILLITRDENLGNQIRLFLGGSYNLKKVFNAKDALLVLSKGDHLVAVVDESTPDISGYDLCTAVRKDFKLQHICVLLLLEGMEEYNKEQSLSCDVDGFLVKPLSQIRFLKKIENLIEKSEQIKSSMGLDTGATSSARAIEFSVENTEPEEDPFIISSSDYESKSGSDPSDQEAEGTVLELQHAPWDLEQSQKHRSEQNAASEAGADPFDEALVFELRAKVAALADEKIHRMAMELIQEKVSRVLANSSSKLTKLITQLVREEIKMYVAEKMQNHSPAAPPKDDETKPK